MISKERLLKGIEWLRGAQIARYEHDERLWAQCVEYSDASRLCRNPLVSVYIATYNQEQYIAGCIDGAIKQMTDFDYEILIADDCSTDKTLEICLDFQRRHPERVRVLHNTVNQYCTGITGRRALSKSRGKYFAFCEGDDYWCNERKLQLQVDKFRSNPNCVVCYTDSFVKHPLSDKLFGPELSAAGYFDNDQVPSREDFICERFLLRTGVWFKTATIMVEKGAYSRYLDEEGALRLREGIQGVRMAMPRYGDVEVVSEPCAVYRVGIGVGAKSADSSDMLVTIDGSYSRIEKGWECMTSSERRHVLNDLIFPVVRSPHVNPGLSRRITLFAIRYCWYLGFTRQLAKVLCLVLLKVLGIHRIVMLPRDRMLIKRYTERMRK